jgi:hypothetical protein
VPAPAPPASGLALPLWRLSLPASPAMNADCFFPPGPAPPAIAAANAAAGFDGASGAAISGSGSGSGSDTGTGAGAGGASVSSAAGAATHRSQIRSGSVDRVSLIACGLSGSSQRSSVAVLVLQRPQTAQPQRRQWCRGFSTLERALAHSMQTEVSSLGTQRGSARAAAARAAAASLSTWLWRSGSGSGGGVGRGASSVLVSCPSAPICSSTAWRGTPRASMDLPLAQASQASRRCSYASTSRWYASIAVRQRHGDGRVAPRASLTQLQSRAHWATCRSSLLK